MTFQKQELDSEENKKGKEANSLKDTSNENLLAKIVELTEKINHIEKKAVATGGGITDADVAKIAAIVVQAQKTLNPQEVDYNKGIREEDIPADDYDPIGTCFCCPLVGYIITCDTRKGHIVTPPYGIKEIFFVHANTRKIQTGKYQQLSSFSTFWSRSKKLTEWLRKHTFYNVWFYESSKEALGVDVSKMLRLGNIMKALQPLEMHDLFRRCKEYDVPITDDGTTMRANIAAKMIERELALEQESTKNILEESAKSAKLLKRE